MLVNIKGIQGEEGTGFESRIVKGVDKGPFECGNCEYFKNNSCGQKDMIERAKKEKIKLVNGRRPVEARDCCEFVDRVGKKKETIVESVYARVAKGGKKK